MISWSGVKEYEKPMDAVLYTSFCRLYYRVGESRKSTDRIHSDADDDDDADEPLK